MKKRVKLRKKRSKRMFSKTAGAKRINSRQRPMRGGFRI